MVYGIGIIGSGLIAEFHARAISRVKNARLVAVLSRTQERAQAFALKFNCRGYSDPEAFYRDDEIQIVTVCTPSGLHLESALPAIRAGKHCIIEKPLEITLKRCDAIINEAAKKDVFVSGIFQSRFYDGAQILKTALDEGRMGRLVLGDAYVKWFRSQEYYDKGVWKGTVRFDGGGTLINQSIHAIDLLQWYMGAVKTVQAVKGMLGHERIEVEDTAVAALEFDNGAMGVIEGSTAVFPGFLKRIEISGTSGTAVLEEADLTVWKFASENTDDEAIRTRFASEKKTGGGAADPAAISDEGHRRQFESFVTALNEGKKPLLDGEEARKSVAIILAIYASAEKGKKMRIG